MKMKGYKLIILILAFLLLHPDLSFAQANRNEAGFVTNLPVLPQKLDLLKVGNRISSFTGEYINDHSVFTILPKENGTCMESLMVRKVLFISLLLFYLGTPPKLSATSMANGTSPCAVTNLSEMVFRFGRCIGMIIWRMLQLRS